MFTIFHAALNCAQVFYVSSTLSKTADVLYSLLPFKPPLRIYMGKGGNRGIGLKRKKAAEQFETYQYVRLTSFDKGNLHLNMGYHGWHESDI